MNELEIQSGQAYITKSDKTAFILWKFDNGSAGGFVSGQDADFYDWNNTVSVVHDSLDLTEEARIELKSHERFEYWKVECMTRFGEQEGGLLWVCTIQWARLMEQKIKEGQRIKEIAPELAKDAGIVEHPDGEFAITILYQCWKHSEDLMSIKDYRPYCTLE